MSVKSLLVFSEINNELEPEFYIVDGDWSRFEGVYINTFPDESVEAEFAQLSYDEDTGKKKLGTPLTCGEVLQKLSGSTEVVHIVRCGFVS